MFNAQPKRERERERLNVCVRERGGREEEKELGGSGRSKCERAS